MLYVFLTIAVVGAAALAVWRRFATRARRSGTGAAPLVPDGSLDVAVTVCTGAGEPLARALGPLIGRALRTEIEMGATAAGPRRGRRNGATVDRITITTSEAPHVLEGVLRAMETCSYAIDRVEGRAVRLGSEDLGPATVELRRHEVPAAD